jgi:hypothetical protein
MSSPTCSQVGILGVESFGAGTFGRLRRPYTERLDSAR